MKNIFQKFKSFSEKHRAIKSFNEHSNLGTLGINNTSDFLYRNHCRGTSNLCLNTPSDRKKNFPKEAQSNFRQVITYLGTWTSGALGIHWAREVSKGSKEKGNVENWPNYNLYLWVGGQLSNLPHSKVGILFHALACQWYSKKSNSEGRCPGAEIGTTGFIWYPARHPCHDQGLILLLLGQRCKVAPQEILEGLKAERGKRQGIGDLVKWMEFKTACVS